MTKIPLIISHRGDRINSVENTIDAATKAIKSGATGLEIDIRACASGEIVVFHDFSLKRMFNRPGYLGRTTYQQLKDMPYIINGQETKFTIDLLDAFLDEFKDSIKINLDAKTIHFFDFKFADAIISHIRNHNLFDSVWVSCFNPFLLQILRLKNRDIKTGYLFQRAVSIHTLYDKSVFTDAWHPYYTILSKPFEKKANKYKKQIYVWTANDESVIRGITDYEVDGIITDNVGLTKKVLDI